MESLKDLQRMLPVCALLTGTDGRVQCDDVRGPWELGQNLGVDVDKIQISRGSFPILFKHRSLKKQKQLFPLGF